MRTLRTAVRLFLAMTLLTGVFYPLGVTLVSQGIFPKQSFGSLVFEGTRLVGSELLAQRFSGERYFWPRPSAVDYNPLPSGGSNLGSAGRALQEQWDTRRAALLAADPEADPGGLPQELLAASGSGLDPELNPVAAAWQAGRVSRARGLTERQQEGLVALMKSLEESPAFGLLGEPRINILKLNRMLDERFAGDAP